MCPGHGFAAGKSRFRNDNQLIRPAFDPDRPRNRNRAVGGVGQGPILASFGGQVFCMFAVFLIIRFFIFRFYHGRFFRFPPFPGPKRQYWYAICLVCRLVVGGCRCFLIGQVFFGWRLSDNISLGGTWFVCWIHRPPTPVPYLQPLVPCLLERNLRAMCSIPWNCPALRSLGCCPRRSYRRAPLQYR